MRVGVAVLFIKEGKILLGKRKSSHGEGSYAPPGGWVEKEESPKDAAYREALEETGLEILSMKEGPWIYQAHDHLSLFFFVEEFKGILEAKEPHKCGKWEWFSLTHLPEPLFGAFEAFLKKNYLPFAI